MGEFVSRASLSRQALIEKLVDVFYEYGYDGATLSVISEKTGLQRASIYHYFPDGKVEMAEAVLAHSDQWTGEHIGKVLESDMTPAEKVRGMFAAIDDVHTRPHQLTLLNVFSYGSARFLFGEKIAARTRHSIDTVAVLLQELGATPELARQRAMDAQIRIEGAMVLARSLNDLGVFRATVRALPDALLQDLEEKPKKRGVRTKAVTKTARARAKPARASS